MRIFFGQCCIDRKIHWYFLLAQRIRQGKKEQNRENLLLSLGKLLILLLNYRLPFCCCCLVKVEKWIYFFERKYTVYVLLFLVKYYFLYES